MFWRKERPTEQLEEHLDKLKIKEEIITKESEIEEKRYLIKELKKRHGHNWKSILGIVGRPDLQTLRTLFIPSVGSEEIPGGRLRR